MKKIVVIGQIAKYPLGGVTWDWLNYLLGFKKLGYDVHYFEDGPEWLYNPTKNRVMLSNYNVQYLTKVMDEFGFASDWTYISRNRNQSKNKIFGNKKIAEIFQKSDMVFNICGSSDMNKLIHDFSIPKDVKKIYVDGDPMINQLKILDENDNQENTVNSHDVFFTYAENIGKSGCEIPIGKNIHWITTRFPIYLDAWKYTFNKNSDTFTTIGNWQSYKGFLYKNKKYSGSKSIEFLKYYDIPKLSEQKMEIALAADTEKKENYFLKKKLKDNTWLTNKNNLKKMETGGWNFTDSIKKSKDWKIYKKYIDNSYGEWSVAKNIYVKASTGWFSGRSTCYLASGKPVILQDTGFSKFIPTGKGLFSFKNKSEALKAIKEVNKNYEFHSKEARRIAEEYFDSDKVLQDMIEKIK